MLRFISQYRHEKRQLEKEIRSIERAYAPSLKNLEGERFQRELGTMRGECEYARIGLEQLETWQVEKKAQKWTVPIPSDLYTMTYLNFSAYRPVLEQDARDKLLRSVRDVRREEIKWWFGILQPSLSLLIGLCGVLMALFAALHKKC